MNIENLFRRLYYTMLALGLLSSFDGASQAAVNVVNYGAKGDLLTLDAVDVVNNSTAVVCPNASFSSADVGKLMEIWNAGKFQTVSNETLVAVITAVNSTTSVSLSVAAGRTANGLSGCYGTDNKPAFAAAIAAATIPTDTIIIPAGNYLLIEPNIDDFWLSGVVIRRGGLTFEGQGKVILTGQGGWRDSTITTTQGPAPKGRRGTLFAVISPTSNNYPLIWNNLTFYGGIDGWNGGGNNGPSTSDGHGWDISHHAIGWYNGPGPLALPTNCTVAGCTLYGWRGEVLIGTTTYQNTFITVSNSLFYDCNASALNLPHAHDINSCTFSNMNFVEEFYRSYATNASWFRNNTIINMQGSGQVGCNGGYPGNPTYTISNNWYYASANSKSFFWTTPATEVLVISNHISGCSSAIGLGVAGYQDEHGLWNSNIVITGNYFTNCFQVVNIQGSGNNRVTDVQVSSNYFDKCGFIGTGYGWSSNVVFSFNYITNALYGGIFDPSATLQGQYFIDDNNTYAPYNMPAGALDSTRLITAGYGSKVRLSVNRVTITLDDSQPWKVPPGASITFTDAQAAWAGNPDGAYPIYSSTAMTGAPKVTLSTGQSQTFYWNKIKGGYAWMTNKIIPPLNLRTNL